MEKEVLNFAGVIIGALIALVGVIVTLIGTHTSAWLKYYLDNRDKKKLDKQRQDLLKAMLADKPKWRRISTLSLVIGASAEETKRLLIDIGARGSKTMHEDGSERWGLISRNPLPRTAEDD